MSQATNVSQILIQAQKTMVGMKKNK